MRGISMVEIDSLKLTQIYLSREKIDRVQAWFRPDLEGFQPVEVHDFIGDGSLFLTDGHTRAYVAWENGVRRIPALYDTSGMVTGTLGGRLYRQDICWCRRFGLEHISALGGRILQKQEYNARWLGRCGYLYYLEAGLLEGGLEQNAFDQKRKALEEQGLFVYGISADYTTLYCENRQGALFEVPYQAIEHGILSE